MGEFASRGGQKLEHALKHFAVEVRSWVCADLGCSTGGFTDCLLQHGAAKVYAVDTGYGVLDWKLRKDPRVEVMERANAMHVSLEEPVDLVTIDVAWTKQQRILPAARRLVKDRGLVLSLIKPHYEADAGQLRRGVLPEEQVEPVVQRVLQTIPEHGLEVVGTTPSPIRGAKGNFEVLAMLRAVSGTRP